MNFLVRNLQLDKSLNISLSHNWLVLNVRDELISFGLLLICTRGSGNYSCIFWALSWLFLDLMVYFPCHCTLQSSFLLVSLRLFCITCHQVSYFQAWRCSKPVLLREVTFVHQYWSREVSYGFLLIVFWLEWCNFSSFWSYRAVLAYFWQVLYSITEKIMITLNRYTSEK